MIYNKVVQEKIYNEKKYISEFFNSEISNPLCNIYICMYMRIRTTYYR